MPSLSVWAVRLALVHLVVGTTIGAVLLAAKAVALPPGLWALRALHVEALLVGFAVQLAVGVAYWILPRVRRADGARPERRRQPMALVAVVLLNAGVLLVGGGLGVAGRVCEAVGAAAFAVHVWPRVREATARRSVSKR